jgi:hypothetical protein
MPRKFKFIGCEIVYREACYLAATGPNQVDVEFLRKGLHDLERADMQTKIQATIDAADADTLAGYEAILMGYARCNDGLTGIRAGRLPLVIPRAHDCITFFFGSRDGYKEYFDAHPGTYYMTTGWCERNLYGDGKYAEPAYGKRGVMGKLGLAESYEQMVEKYGKENADFILESLGDWSKNYSKFLYLTMGVCDEQAFIEEVKKEAVKREWQFELREGSLTLLRKMFLAQWDQDFLVVQPGQTIVARNDERILDAESL